jgi:hypothetical protein
MRTAEDETLSALGDLLACPSADATAGLVREAGAKPAIQRSIFDAFCQRRFAQGGDAPA